MQIAKLFSKTSKQISAEEVSKNAKYLVRAGYIDKAAAGVYSFLPLGVRVIEKISRIVREEMNAAGGQEILMPVLHPKENWEKTGRWRSLDILFKVKGQAGEFALGPTHEEIVVPLASKFIHSYSDLPRYVYQIQTKFRDEPRSKSGLLRGREFLMKDLYSFHASEEDLEEYYNVMQGAYQKVFKRLGLEALETEASGGTFSKYSHEYQVLCETGEDLVYFCKSGHFARNKEIIEDLKSCPECGEPLSSSNAIEVGNIFKLKTKYSDPFKLTFTDTSGKEKPVVMGCYGIGISRLMGAIVEVLGDDKGIVWPSSVSPFDVHLVSLTKGGEKVYKLLKDAGIEVLWDDREDVSAGEKFADADLMGISVRLVVSQKTGEGNVEWKSRDKDETQVIKIEEALERLSS